MAAKYVTKIRTADGDKQIDYNALANKPDVPSSAEDVGAIPVVSGTKGQVIGFTSDDVIGAMTVVAVWG